MLNSIKISLKDTLIYGMGNIAVKLVGLVLIPLFTDPEFFSVDEFGIMGLLDISGLVLITVITFFLPQSFTRWYWDKENKENQKGLFFLTFITQVVVSVLFCLLLLPFSGSFSGLLFDKADYSGVISLVILASAFQAINNVINTKMRLQSKPTLYIITNISKLVVVLTLTLYFILSERMGLEGIYLAQLIGNSLYVLALLGYIIKNSVIYFDFRVFREMNIYGIPLFLGSLAAVALNVVDRYALNSLSLLKYVALYTLAIKLTNVLKIVIVDSVRFAVGPIILKQMDAADNRRFYAKILLYTSYVLMFSVVAISAFSLEIIQVITKSDEFRSAVIIIPILSFSVFFVNMKEVTIYGLHIAKKSRIMGLLVVFATALSIILNILMVPVWDIKGAAMATLISQVFYWFSCYRFSQKAFHIPYEIKKLALIFITGACLSYMSLLFNGIDLIPRILLKTLCVISFPFILYLFNFYEEIEIQTIKGFLAKWSDIKMLRKNLTSLKDIKEDM